MDNYFITLFNEFINLLKEKGLLESRFSIHYDNTAFVDFQILLRSLDIFGEAKELKSLPSFTPLFQLIANKEGISLDEAINKNIYPVFGFKYSELFNYIYLSQVAPLNQKKNNADLSKISNESFISAVCSGEEIIKTNEYFIFFENLEIENDFQINETLSFIKLSQDFIKEKIQNYSEPNTEWVRVKSAIHYKGNLENDELVIKLSTLLRLKKKGDIRYKAIYQKCIHWYKGTVYKNYKNSFSETDYVEHATINEAPVLYQIKDIEFDEISSFIRGNLPKMNHLLYSSRVFNLLQSINHQLKISIQFFVIESFFPHIRFVDIQKETVQAVRKILGGNDKLKKRLWKYYDIRSDIAHGDLEAASKKSNNMPYEESLEKILIALWLRLLEINWKPEESESRLKEIFNEK